MKKKNDINDISPDDFATCTKELKSLCHSTMHYWCDGWNKFKEYMDSKEQNEEKK